MRQCATKAIPPGVLVCIVLTSGAMFGMAAQSTLHHVGLDLGSVGHDLFAGWAPHARSALAWWAWWFVVVGAFFVGHLTLAVVHFLGEYGWLLGGLRFVAAAALALTLAAIGHLHAAPPQLGASATAGVGLAVVVTSALLAALGAIAMRGSPRSVYLPAMARGPYRAVSLVARPLAPRGGGSANSGFPMRRFWHGHALVPGSRRPQLLAKLGRLAQAASLTLTAFASASAVGAGGVLFELCAPVAIHRVVAWYPVPPEPPAFRVVQVDITAPILVYGPLGDVADAGPHLTVPMSDSGFTFAKGYLQRLAAAEAAGPVVATAKADVKIPAKLAKRRYAAALRMAASYRRQNSDGRIRQARNRRDRDRHDRRVEQRYAANDHDGRWYDSGRRDYAEPPRRTSHTHHRGEDREHGFDRFARYNSRYSYGF
jgi:hypothetical protein